MYHEFPKNWGLNINKLNGVACPMCGVGLQTIEYNGTKICQDCYDELTATDADRFANRMIEDTIHTTDVCWIALKAQLKCHNPNKNEVLKLKSCMIKLIENLSIITKQ